MIRFRFFAVAGMFMTLPYVALGQKTAPPAEPTARAQVASATDCYRLESERFSFYSDVWINLHHFLYQWARNLPEMGVSDRRRAVEVVEGAELDRLNDEERASWEQAVAYYRERLISRDLLFNRGMVELRGQLAAIACSKEERSARLGDTEFDSVLRGAVAVYRQRWWPQHHEANAVWIEERLKALKKHERALSSRLAGAYGGVWPDERIRVDISAYSNWAGGYTTSHPDHVTISNAYQGLEGLEILFHEISHAAFFEQRILGQVAAAFREHEAEPSGRLLHAIQFATPAEILRSLVDESHYVSISDRVHERGSFREEYRAVLKDWRPFIAGETNWETALDRIAAEFTAE